jgi:hypothetical protein
MKHSLNPLPESVRITFSFTIVESVNINTTKQNTRNFVISYLFLKQSQHQHLAKQKKNINVDLTEMKGKLQTKIANHLNGR